MRILVISLLRLGDIVLSTPVFEGLKRKYPDVQIDILINRQFESITKMIPAIDHVHFLDREQMQESMCNPQRPLFEAYDVMRAQMNELRSKQYDLVINLTHNRFSGWVASLIEGKKTLGLQFHPSGQASFGSSWFRFLNESGEDSQKDYFHYSDIFYFGSILPQGPHPIRLKETKQGYLDALSILTQVGVGPYVTVQVLTSDVKKNYSLTGWRKALEVFSFFHPEVQILLLGAPNEKLRLQELESQLKESNVKAHLVICNLEVALSLIQKSSLVVTGDTSIKHIASATKTKIIEISVGSSNYRKTGVYQAGATIIQSKADCAPCSHRSPCSQKSYICSEMIDPEVIALTMSKVITHQEHELRTIAYEYNDQVDILRTEVAFDGIWTAYSLTQPFEIQRIDDVIQRCTRKILLDPHFKFTQENLESEARLAVDIMIKTYPEQSRQEWLNVMLDLQVKIERDEKRIGSTIQVLKEVVAKLESENRLSSIREELGFVEKTVQDLELGSDEIQKIQQVILMKQVDEGAVKALHENLLHYRQKLNTQLKLTRFVEGELSCTL